MRESLDLKGRTFAELPPFNTGKAVALYHALLGPAENLLAGAKSLIIVPDGALQSLPPALLVTQEPTAPIAGFTDYASVAWLARRYALTVLPAVSSLTSLRRFAEARHGGSPFVGFGNPDFKGRLAPLPDTARLLRAEAKVLHAPVSSVYLSHEATVTKVKSLDLGDTRVVAFATHGLIAGDMKALAEPALALTPASQDDDGLFRASEVSQLQLNADWVLLTACNTAAPDGSPRAEGLSGLAKAFFYAGARSLLVSHWPVESVATVKLTTGAFLTLERDPNMGRAEAFRRAMLAMIDDAGKSENPAYEAHPLFWAPFVVVGEGAPGL